MLLSGLCGAGFAALGIRQVQRDLARQQRARYPLSHLSTGDLIAISHDIYTPIDRCKAAVAELQRRMQD